MTERPYACFPQMKYFTVFVVATLINTVLGEFAILSVPIAPGASGLYFAVAVMIVFALWFGIYGAISAYAGSFIAAWILSGFSIPVNLVWSLADFWQALIPLVAFMVLKGDITLKSPRDIGIFLVFGWLLNNLIGALWGAGILVLSGSSGGVDFLTLFTGWVIGNLLVTIIVAPVLLRFVTPWVEKKGLRVRGYWS